MLEYLEENKYMGKKFDEKLELKLGQVQDTFDLKVKELEDRIDIKIQEMTEQVMSKLDNVLATLPTKKK